MSIIPFELPNSEHLYPPCIIEARNELYYEVLAEKENPNIRTKLLLIAKAFILFAAQLTIEDTVKVETLKAIDRRKVEMKMLREAKRTERLTNG